MTKARITPERKKKIKTVLSMMNKQNQRFIPVTKPLIEMMDLVTSDAELDYLLQMGTELFDYDSAQSASNMPAEEFQAFFDRLRRKGLVHLEFDKAGKEVYRLNAIAVGWYELMMHYVVGKPQEKAFSEKWNEYFKFFQKFNFFPMRNMHNLVMPSLIKPNQESAIMNPQTTSKSKRKTIPINTALPEANTSILPSFYVNELVEKHGDQNTIIAMPCVCRHGNSLIDSQCNFDIPKDSCIAFGRAADAWVNWGYARHISKEEALDILKTVRDKGAVHSVIHERDDHNLPAVAICNCCWDCCGILKSYNMGAIALSYKASYTARIKDDANCKSCGNCEKFCPTTAMSVTNKKVSFRPEKCIGCGQCAFQCRQNNIELYPNEREVFLPILKKSEARITD